MLTKSPKYLSRINNGAVHSGVHWFIKLAGNINASVEIGVVENIVSTSEDTQKSIENRQQLDAVRALPETEREAVWLVFAEGLTHKQAAEILGCAEGTISSRIHEARKKLTSNGGRKHG